MTTENRHWLLTGGIGSGKSAVREMLASHGARTIDSDSLGHQVLMPHGPAFAQVSERWPGVVGNGQIDRSALAAIVFEDAAELQALEAITHPHIFDMIRSSVERFPKRTWVVEMPLLGNRLGEGWSVIVVDALDSIRLDWSLARGLEEPDVLARMASQPSREQWLASADIVIPNHGSLEELEVSVELALSTLFL